MQNYILCIDQIGKVSIELSAILDTSIFKIINISNGDNIILRAAEFKNNLKLIIWSIYSEDNKMIDNIIKFRKIDKFNNIPIIIISSINKNDFVLNSIKSGANDYIIRPYNDLLLKDKILNITKLSENFKIIDSNDNLGKIDFTIGQIMSITLKGASRGKYDISMVMFSIMESTTISLQIQKKTIKILKKILDKKTRETDIVLEFNNNLLILLPFTNDEGTTIFYNKIVENLKRSNILNKESKGVIISSSYHTLSYNQVNIKEDILIKRLQQNLKVCIAIPKI